MTQDIEKEADHDRILLFEMLSCQAMPGATVLEKEGTDDGRIHLTR